MNDRYPLGILIVDLLYLYQINNQFLKTNDEISCDVVHSPVDSGLGTRQGSKMCETLPYFRRQNVKENKEMQGNETEQE